MPNRHCGEVAVELGGRRRKLCLTLGALAELEDAFGVADLPAMVERFATGWLSSRDLLTLLAAGLRGGGEALTDDEIAALPLEAGGVEALAGALGDLLIATFGGAPAHPPQPQGA
jgi:hypothetical protein